MDLYYPKPGSLIPKHFVYSKRETDSALFSKSVLHNGNSKQLTFSSVRPRSVDHLFDFYARKIY